MTKSPGSIWRIAAEEIWVVLFMNSGSTYLPALRLAAISALFYRWLPTLKVAMTLIIKGFGIPKNFVGKFLNVWQRD